MILFLLWLAPSVAGEVSENQVKSAYVLNFAKFVEWPTRTFLDTDKINLCVLGSKTLSGTLFELEGRKVGGRALHVISNPNTGDTFNSCHLLFIGETEQRRLGDIFKTLGEAPILTISDSEDFAEKGGSIGLVLHDNKIEFEVNWTALQKSKLHLPGQLLNLASRVYER